MVGVTTKTGPIRAPAAAARQEPNAKVAVYVRSVWMPMRDAVSGSWKVARMALPSLVRCIKT